MTHMMSPMFLTEDARWQAVLRHDIRADGQFFYGVRSTGVYCRPSCPSRRPKRENVAFFTSHHDAERAGLRACRRCAPAAASLHDRQVAAIRRACTLIEEAEEPPALKDLAAAVGLSRFHFHRLFKEIVGITPKEYAATHQVKRLQRELEAGAPVAQAIYEAGYGSSSRAYEQTHRTLGMTPSKFKAGAVGIRIHYVVTRSALGWLLVAATDRGICTIEFGESAEALAERLRCRFPAATLEEGGAELKAWVEAVTSFITSPARGLHLPLDIQGTAFQRRVWKALQDIPPGTTVSYTAVAEALGQPGAARAVARACASNAIALAIPCHRVVGRNGELSGYRWGVERKRALLEREREEELTRSVEAAPASAAAAPGDRDRPGHGTTAIPAKR